MGEEEGFSFIALDAADIQNLAINTNINTSGVNINTSSGSTTIIHPNTTILTPHHNTIKTDADGQVEVFL